MAYGTKIQEAQSKAHNYSVATRILEKMDNLRMITDDNNSRRWIWELLQNAKDVSGKDRKVNIKINLNHENSTLEFSHNGNPFTTENITFLIEQVSTKGRSKSEHDKYETTGRFGTGFLTTHILSEVVSIVGILKEPDEPYKNFHLTLDRTGRNADSIVESVEHSLEELSLVDSASEIKEYDENDFNTKFSYTLDEKRAIIARAGIDDLCATIVYVLAFLPEIKSVEIVQMNTVYELSSDHELIGEDIKIITIIQKTDDSTVKHKVAILSDGDVSIAIPIEMKDNHVCFQEINTKTPRLFCSFPLVGTESLPVPIIINSPEFNPTEPRDGVYLTDSSDSKVQDNKSLFIRALDLYYYLLEYAAKNGFQNMFLLAKIASAPAKNWLSSKWFSSEILKPSRNKLLEIAIVDTKDNERISMQDICGNNNIWFPSHKDKQFRHKIWELCSLWTSVTLPKLDDIDNWHTVMWSDCAKLSLETLTSCLEERQNVSQLKNELLPSITVIEWLNLYYSLLDEEDIFVEQIVNDKYAVIPNQNGVFKKRSELKIDKDIEEELKNVLYILDEDCRDTLRLEPLCTGKKIELEIEEQDTVINKINKIISENQHPNIDEACDYLISLFSDDDQFPKERKLLFEFCKDIFISNFQIKRTINNWSEDIWSNAEKMVIRRLVASISSAKNIDSLDLLYMREDVRALHWLNTFISFLVKKRYDYLLNDKDMPILPNQNGDFLTKDALFLDDEIDEKLKDISAELGWDFRSELLETNLYLELPENRVRTKQNLADEISKLLQTKFKESPRSEETRKVFKKMFLWFKENNKKGKLLFREIYKIKHKLYDDDEIAGFMEKSEKMDELLEKHSIDFADLEGILSNESNAKLAPMENFEKQEITEEFLIQSGISSKDKLDKIFEDSAFSANFVHHSDNCHVKFEFVKKILNRSKDNVLNYLRSKEEYDLENIVEISDTIFLVKKNNEEIFILARPSDYDQVIIYYDTEKDLLDYEKDWELWVEDGKQVPQKLSLGKILKLTETNRIPLKRKW